VLVAAYFVGKALRDRVPESAARSGLLLGWVTSVPVIIMIILRAPDWGDIEWSRDIIIFIAFAVAGALLLLVLTNPNLGEPGRLIAAAVLIGALALWAVSMLMVIRLLALALAGFALAAPTFAGELKKRVRYAVVWVFTALPIVFYLALVDTESTLEITGTSFLGGLALTFVLAVVGIVLSFPIGVAMALGRTSTMPIFRLLSTVYIEVVRGIPFITVLIFADLILELFLPEGISLDDVVQAIAATTFFSAAYLAENVRGGLQAIPKGQYEASKALGMTTFNTTVFIVLPQALRAVVPALVGQTIAIFKDTSLVAIIGLFDLLFIGSKVVPAQTAFLGLLRENLLFVAAVYWIFTFSFSRASVRLEKKLGLGVR
jgi:general L-amino acid transport system permease protein